MSEVLTNEQKYKTAEERKVAYKAYIEDFTQPIIGQFEWLALEAEYEKKPKPCPFCGDECYVDDGATPRVVCINKDSCCYQGAIARNKAEAIAAHNRVCRAVEAVKKGETK